MKWFRRLLRFGFLMDALRVWPRFFVSVYLFGLVKILDWYLTQPAATWDRSGFVAVYAGLCIPLLRWYMDNGVDWNVFLALFQRHMGRRRGDERDPVGLGTGGPGVGGVAPVQEGGVQRDGEGSGAAPG